MNKLLSSTAAVAGLAALASLFAPLPSTGQTPPAAPAPAPVAAPAAAQPKYNEADLMKLINEVADQQVQLKANQDQIETKLATIQEDVRQARIFAARGGKAP